MAISSGLGAAVVASRVLPALAHHWWVFLLRGLVGIAFGLVAFFYPVATLYTFIVFYAVFSIVDGVFAFLSAVRGQENMGARWWLALIGILGVVAGLAAYLWPGVTAVALLTLIGIWALINGVVEIVGAIRLRAEIDNEWLLLIHGILSALFGLIVLARPSGGALALIWFIAAFALVSGTVLVILSFRLKGLASKA
jgi:uncharacterized membrane protein HdeD (DUF308 family)